MDLVDILGPTPVKNLPFDPRIYNRFLFSQKIPQLNDSSI